MRQNIRITPEGTWTCSLKNAWHAGEAESLLADLFVCHGFSEVMTPGLEFLTFSRPAIRPSRPRACIS